MIEVMGWLDGIPDSIDLEFELTLGDSERQRSLVCCKETTDGKELDTT